MSQLLEKAEKAYVKKNYDYAIALWLQHLKLKPDDLDCRKKLRLASRESAALSGKRKTGRKFFGLSVDKLKSLAVPLNSKDPESTMNKCEEKLKDDPTSVPLLFRLGEACALAGYHPTAVWAFQDVLSIEKDHKEACRHAARSLKESGDYERAIEHYELLRKLEPADPEANNGIRNLAAKRSATNMSERTKGGGNYRDLIDTKQASKLEKLQQRVRTPEQARERIIDLKEELAKNPDDIKLVIQVSDMHVMCKEWDEAGEWLEKAIAIDPDDFGAKEKLGDLKIKQLDETLAKLKAAARKDPRYKPRYEKHVKERLSYLVEEYRARSEAHPTELKWAFSLGKALHDCGEYEPAIKELQKAKTDSKYKVEGGYYLGLCLYRKKNLRLSIKELEAARKDLFDMDDDNNKQITYLLGRIYEAAKKKERALEEYEKIAEVDYSYKDIQKRMEVLGGI